MSGPKRKKVTKHHSAPRKNARELHKKKIETVDETAMKIVAGRKGLPLGVVRDVVLNGQSGFTASIIKNGTFAAVRWPWFGNFKVNPKSLSLMKYYKGLDPGFKRMFMKKVKTTGVWPRKPKKKDGNQD